MNTCPRCKRTFSTYQGLGLHFHHTNRTPKARRDRLCPDNRTAEEARAQDVRLAGVRVRLREPEMMKRVLMAMYPKGARP